MEDTTLSTMDLAPTMDSFPTMDPAPTMDSASTMSYAKVRKLRFVPSPTGGKLAFNVLMEDGAPLVSASSTPDPSDPNAHYLRFWQSSIGQEFAWVRHHPDGNQPASVWFWGLPEPLTDPLPRTKSDKKYDPNFHHAEVPYRLTIDPQRQAMGLLGHRVLVAYVAIWERRPGEHPFS